MEYKGRIKKYNRNQNFLNEDMLEDSTSESDSFNENYGECDSSEISNSIPIRILQIIEVSQVALLFVFDSEDVRNLSTSLKLEYIENVKLKINESNYLHRKRSISLFLVLVRSGDVDTLCI